jgi:hypothetical protein
MAATKPRTAIQNVEWSKVPDFMDREDVLTLIENRNARPTPQNEHEFICEECGRKCTRCSNSKKEYGHHRIRNTNKPRCPNRKSYCDPSPEEAPEDDFFTVDRRGQKHCPGCGVGANPYKASECDNCGLDFP